MRDSHSRTPGTLGGLLRGVSTYLFGDVVAFALNAAVFFWLLRRLTPEDFGKYAVSQSILSLLVPLVLMGMGMTGSHYMAVASEGRGRLIRRVVTLRILVWLVASAALGLLAAFTKDVELSKLFVGGIPYLLVQAVQLEFVFIGLEKGPALVRSRVLAAVAQAGLVMFFVKPGVPLWVVPLLAAASLLLGTAAQYAWVRFEGIAAGAAGDGVSFGTLFVAGLATSAGQFVQTGYYNLDFLIMSALKVDPAEVGEYGAVSRAVQLAVFPLAALINASGPRYARTVDPSLVSFRMLERMTLAVSLVIGLAGAAGLFLVAPRILESIAGRPMPVAREVLVVFPLGYFLIAAHSPFTAILPFVGRPWHYLAANAGALGVAGVACSVLIPLLGFRGAGLAWVATIFSLLFFGAAMYRSWRRSIGPGSPGQAQGDLQCPS